MTSRVAATGWWGLLLLAVVACTADAEQEVAPSTSAVATTDGASLPDKVVVAEASIQPDATTLTTEPPTTSTSVPPTTLPDNLTIVEVMVREGRVVSEGRVEIPLGNRILMRFDTDSRLLVHVHGYDQEFWVEVGTLSTHEFEGKIPGIFEVEDHVTHRPLLELQVSP